MLGGTAAEVRVAGALAELIGVYGADRLSDPATLRSALNDHLGADATALRREVKLLTDAAAEGIPAQLRAAGGPGQSGDGGPATARLLSLGIAEPAARFAVSAWATSLGTPLPRSPTAAGGTAPVSAWPSSGWTSGGVNPAGVSPGGVSPGGVSPGGVSPGGVSPGGTAWGQGWNQTAVQPPVTSWGQQSVEPGRPRRGKRWLVPVAAAGALVLVLIAVLVGVGLLSGGNDEKVFGLGPAGEQELRDLLPSAMTVRGRSWQATSFADTFEVSCGIQEPAGLVQTINNRYGPAQDGSLGASSADTYTSTAAAQYFYLDVQARLSNCEPFSYPLPNYPKAVARFALDDTFTGPGLRYTLTYDCGCSSAPGAVNDLVIQQYYRFLQVGNLVANVAVVSPGEVAAQDRGTVEAEAEALHARMREATGA